AVAIGGAGNPRGGGRGATVARHAFREPAGGRAPEISERLELPGNQHHHESDRDQCRFPDPYRNQNAAPANAAQTRTGRQPDEENTMKSTPDDPRLTAYALGELDPAERAAIEAELEKSFALQQALEEIRETATVLKTKLAEEELPGLAFAQQLKIENQLTEPAGRPAMSFWRILFYGGASAAAACIILALVLPALTKSKPGTQHVALNSPANSQTKTQAPVPEKKPAVVTTASSTPVAPAIITAMSPASTGQKPQPPAQEKQAAGDMVVQSAPPAPPAQPSPA